MIARIANALLDLEPLEFIALVVGCDLLIGVPLWVATGTVAAAAWALVPFNLTLGWLCTQWDR